ncbi:MAG: hypothetical protein KDC38_03210 [Planctomycetes bacterium]|nr:hypothetical protein [Planctomycetota bacterium]
MEPSIQQPDGYVPKRDSGITLVESLVCVTLTVFGFVGITSLQLANERSQIVATEEAIVRNALRNQAERIRGTPFDEIIDAYQSLTFSVSELGATGLVTIFTDETESSAEAAAFGLPRDLDGDGTASDTDISSHYMLLPIRIQITVPSGSGSNVFSLHMLLSSEG